MTGGYRVEGPDWPRTTPAEQVPQVVKSILGIKQSGSVSRADTDFSRELEQAAAGDPAAVRRLVIEFEPGLTRFARRRGVPEVDAVVNAAFSDAFRNLPTFRGTDRRAFRAYLFRILRCRIVDDQRLAFNQPKRTLDIDSDVVSDLVDRDSSSFDDRVVDRQLVDDILGRLTDEQREVLEMRVLSGLSIRETADRTGRSEVAVKAMQRRALLSLRSLLVVMAVLVVCGAGIAAIVGSRGPVTVVENAPADLAPDNFDGRTDPDEQSAPLVVETPEPATDSNSGPSTTVVASAIEAGAGPDDGGPTSVIDASNGADTTAGPGDDGADSGGAGNGGADGSGPGSTDGVSTTTTPPEPTFAIAPLPDSVSNTPCTVVTDGSPAVGEVAFVSYRLEGPYALFDKTSVDILGPGGSSLLLPGSADPKAARDGDRFPFVIKGNMFWDAGFAVSSSLVDGEVTTRCKIGVWAIRPPCTVILGDSAEKGDKARVVYNPHSRYELLSGQPTHVMGWDHKSVLVGGGSVAFEDDIKSDFTINGFMLKDGPLEVRTSLADGAAHAVCRIADS